MFNFKRTEAAELHPMELALLGGSGPAATANVQDNPQDSIDWNYLLNRK